ncbi:MAG: O-6-methylguanine methyltransferase [Dehalococcoidia bacterium]|nr:O-6-methylguanine methyltransferase [Dehalococcoidia bacterium]
MAAPRYTLVDIPGWGWVGILASPRGIRRLTLPQPSPLAALIGLGLAKGDMEPGPTLGAFPDLEHRLEGYFRGERVSFPDALDLVGTPFQREVWEVVRTIPYRETRSYAWVAHQTGRPGAARSVGQAMGANPVPIIVPCHRVIGTRGDLRGYGGPQGVPLKQRLLEMEYGNSAE